MTVHSAKGLEFHVVFVSGLEEGLFPHEQSAAEDDGLEEERRLMYVALTRARTRLYLSFAQSRLLHGQTRYGVASRFVDELPKDVLKWLTPKGRTLLDDKAWRAEEPSPRYRASKVRRRRRHRVRRPGPSGPGAHQFRAVRPQAVDARAGAADRGMTRPTPAGHPGDGPLILRPQARRSSPRHPFRRVTPRRQP